MTVTLSWRGPLRSCNYGCDYCPFATRPARARTLAADRAALDRFVRWVEGADRPLRVRLVPYGEGMVHPWYPDALGRLASLPHVEAVSIQTNGSSRPTRIAGSPDKVTLWVSHHPTETALSPFLARLAGWRALGVRLAVGAVADPANAAAIAALHAALPEGRLWLNAKKPGVRYSPAEVAVWSAYDPDFGIEARPVRSRGLPCGAGERGLLVEGDGTLRRCVLVREPLGNLYADDLATVLRPRPCPRGTCTCWLGYSQVAAVPTTTRRG